MHEMILCKLGEVVLKGLNRRSFEDKLMSNVNRRVPAAVFVDAPLRPQAPAEQERKRRHIDDAEREPDRRGKRKGRGRPRAAERREQQDKSRALSDMAQNGKRAKLDVVIPFHLIHPCKISVLRYWMASAR